MAECSLRWLQEWLSSALCSPGSGDGLGGNCVAWGQLLILWHFALRQLLVLGAEGGQGTGSGCDGDISFTVLFGSVYHLWSNYTLKHPRSEMRFITSFSLVAALSDCAGCPRQQDSPTGHSCVPTKGRCFIHQAMYAASAVRARCAVPCGSSRCAVHC